MTPITVEQLSKQLNRLVKEGKGDYQIFLTDDEECNGYHGCWYLGTEPIQWDDDTRNFSESINRDLSCLGKNKDKAIYLG